MARSYGVFTLPEIETECEGEAERCGFYNNAWKYFHCFYSRDQCKFSVGSVHILSVSVSGSVNESLKG